MGDEYSFTNEDGTPIHHRFELEREGFHIVIILKSGSGAIRGDGTPHNSQYNQGVERIISVLSELQEPIEKIILDTRKTRALNLTEGERTLSLQYPLSPWKHDSRDLRLEMGRLAQNIGQEPGAKGGNNQKQLRVYIRDFNPGLDFDSIAKMLSGVVVREDYNILNTHLKKRNFDFISPGTHHLQTVYGLVKEEYPDLCDDNLVIEENKHPFWKNRTQFALNDCKGLGYVTKGERNYWIFGEGAAINPPTELVDDEELESSDSYGNGPPPLPSPSVSPSPPPSFHHAKPRASPPANDAPNSPSIRTSGPRTPEVGFVYVRALYSVADQEEFRLGSSFKHGSFRDGREEGRRSSGYTDLPPFDEDGLWLGSEFVAVAGPFEDYLLAERQFSNRLVPLWNIQIGIGKQKEWHPYHGETHEERRDELVQITSELSSFAREYEVKFEYRSIFDSLCT
jgi:hypothetical protein